MIRSVFLFTLVTGYASASASSENERHFGGGFGGFGGQISGDLGLGIFCERANTWLSSAAANVTATNGTIPSTQELFVNFLTSICSSTRSGIPLDTQNPSERHVGGSHGHGFGGSYNRPTRNPLRAFCGRTQLWLNFIGTNITVSNGTTTTMQQAFADFLTSICDGVTRSAIDSSEEDGGFYGLLAQVRHWFNHPKPKSPLQVFCDGATQWLSTSGINVTAINGTGDNLPVVFVDFLTNICDNTRRVDSHALSGAADNTRWFNWPFRPTSYGCLGEFCEQTNEWLGSTTLNITSTSNGTALSPSQLFVNFLESICEE